MFCAFISNDQLGAHEFVQFDLGSLNCVDHGLFVSIVAFLQFFALKLLLGDNVRLFLLQSAYGLPQVVVFFLESLDFVMHISFGLVRDESFLQAVGNRTVVELLQGALEHAGLVPDSDQLVASLDAVERDLSNDLIEALREELLANRADAVGSSAQVVQLFVQPLFEIQNVGARRGRCRDVTHPELIVLDYLLRRQDLVEVILVALLEAGSALEGRLAILGVLAILLADEGRGDQNGSFVFYKRVNWSHHILFCL